MNRRVAVTGASRGLGFAIARRLAAGGASVMLCARKAEDLSAAAGAMPTTYAERIMTSTVDVRSSEDLTAAAASAQRVFGGIDSIVCNAGILGPKGTLDRVDIDEWTATFETNVYGVVRTVRAFLPLLRASARGRIVILSGGGATKPMPNLSAYAATKAAVVRLGETLAEELAPESISVNMIAPGAVNTQMLDELLAAGPEAVGETQYAAAIRQRDTGGTPPEKGADLCAWLLSSNADGITGKLISAVWDPWERLGEHRDELALSDIYTLRRIVPEDRGKSW